MIDPNSAPLNLPLWCVYGPNSFPTIFCCVINEHAGAKAVWGYSVYKRSPGFRTLGRNLSWLTDHDAKLFLTQEEALAHLKELISPKKSALNKLK